VTHTRAACSQKTFVLQAGYDIGQFGVVVGIENGGIKSFETRGGNNGTDLDFMNFFRISKVDGTCGTKFFAGPAFAFLDEDTIFSIQGILQGDSLTVWDVRGFPFAQTAVEFVGYLFGTFFSTHPTGDTFVNVDVTRVFFNGYGKITSFALDLLYLTECEEFDVQVPTALYQFR